MEGSAVLSRNGDARTRQERLRSPFVQRYWAFLSYAHEDSATADWLHRALEGFRVPKALVGRRAERFLIPARLTPIFRDRSELAASTDLSEEIQEALDSSRHLIVLCSPAAAQSHWVNEEIRTFKQFRPDGEVLAAIVDGEPWASEIPGREMEECFPPALRERFDEQGQPTGERAEPIAADLRPEGDGRERGLLKIVAGMLDLRLDDLVQRDEVERHRRWALIAAASIAGMLLTSGLAVTAIQSRDAARDQRREAEGLIGFMIGDLRDKLEPVGRLDALEAVGARVLAYYDRRDKSKLSDEALAQRAKALTLMIDLAQRRGDLDGALRLYRLGSAGTAEALRRDPDNPQRLFDHAQNVFRIGDIADRTGHSAEAENAYQEYKRLADKMVDLEPDNAKWQMEAQSASANLGILLFKDRRYSQASSAFERALLASDRLSTIAPTDLQNQEDRLAAIAWLADAQLAEGKLASATGLRERQLALIGRLSAANRQDTVLLQKEVPARRALGRLLTIRGDPEAGLRQLQKAVAVGDQLIAIEPKNLEWVELAAGAQLELGGILLLMDRTEDAARQVEGGCVKVERLSARGDQVADWGLLQIDCLTRRARIALARRSTGDALVIAGQALAAAEERQVGNDADRRIALATIHMLIGDIHQQAGDSAAALSEWRTALNGWPEINETPRQMAIRAELLRNAGRSSEARQLDERLQAIGFQTLI